MRHTILLAVSAFCVSVATPSFANDAITARHMWDDAELTDVFFIDADRGWAVGDRGVIWATNDGGRNWYSQRSGVGCRLESVCFVDERTGWATGGWTHPYTHRTSGVLLHTTDGGKKWTKLPELTLPALRRVKFFDDRHGWAVGAASALHPSGLLRTNDGGRSWSSVSSEPIDGWHDAEFADVQSGVVVSRHGEVSAVLGTKSNAASLPDVGLRNVRRLRIAAPHRGWLVGDGGLILFSDNGGLSWRAPPAPLPDDAAQHFDFNAVAVVGDSCWIAGSPGTCVAHSSDGGRSWKLHRTRQALPIRSLFFLDANRGWAVASMGTILATRDGGRTWLKQRGGGQRAALIGVYSEPQNVPLELFARLAGNEGYLSVSEFITRRDVEVRSAATLTVPQRARESFIAVGGSACECAWQFPLRQAGLRMSAASIIDGWNRTCDGDGLAKLEEHVVRKIRQWRPDVIVTEPTSLNPDNASSHLINQIVMTAVDKAADEHAYPQQIAVAGLGPWQVKKVFSQSPQGSPGGLTLVTGQLAPYLGRSLAEHADAARAILFNEYVAAPQNVGFDLLVNRLPNKFGREDFFSGIVLQPGEEARRPQGELAANNLTALRQMTQRKRNAEQLIARSADGPQGGAFLLAQIEDLTRGINAASAGEILYRLAWQFRQTGQHELSAEVLQLLIRRFPDHALVEPALVWLIEYYASSEAAWRIQRIKEIEGQTVAAQFGAGFGATSPVTPADFRENAAATGNANAERSPTIRAGHQVGAVTASSESIARTSRAALLGNYAERKHAELFAEPIVRFPLAAAVRREAGSRQAERLYRSLTSARHDNAWALCAASELWLRRPVQNSPKSVYRCAKIATKPRLDGKLDDSIWQAAQPLELTSALNDDGRWPAAAMLACDDEFLYVAIRCRKAPEVDYSKGNDPRPRDPNLDGRDRVDLLIDLNRDYATYYRLTIDHRGWARESCLGDTVWNAQWFIAADASNDAWTVEAAIPLSELTGERLTRETVWAVGLQRTIPGVGFQSWTHPAAAQPRPAGFGLLMFGE